MHWKLIGLGLALFISFTGCTNIPLDQVEEHRAAIDNDAAEILEEYSEADPAFKAALGEAVGYFTGSQYNVQGLIFGGGSGYGVLVDQRTGERVYMDITRWDIGLGFGAKFGRGVALIHDKEIFESLLTKKWKRLNQVESSVGKSGSLTIKKGKGFTIYTSATESLLASATSRMVRLTPNQELNSSGVANYGIPNLAGPTMEPTEDKIWGRTLPIWGQKVIDRGFELPYPLGVSLLYAYTDQRQDLTKLRIGFNGSDKIPIESVTFPEVYSISHTYQTKIDAWIFPFMNVYGVFGYVDGKGPVTFTIDGNTLLEDFDIDCGGIIPSPLCILLKDKSVTIPVEARFRGYTYSVGTILAGGWNGWFVVAPFNFTYADLEGKNIDGYVTTIAPRFGRLVPMGQAGNLGVFFGGQYMQSKQEIESGYTFPGTEATVEYLIHQENSDEWNLLLGFNWDMNRTWSATFEYAGFINSRVNVVGMIGYRW